MGFFGSLPSRGVTARQDASRVTLALLAVFVVMGTWTSVVSAAPTLNFTSFSAGGLNADETPSIQAGAHPFELTTAFTFGTVLDPRVGFQVPAGAVKDTVVELPPGVIGDPSATPQCSQNNMNGNPGSFGSCPTDTQIGYADLEVQFIGPREVKRVPVFNMAPPAGEPAQFAFVIIASVTHIDVQVRNNGDGNYGVIATAHNINAAVPVYSVAVHLWGVPAASSHDALRFRTGAYEPGQENGQPLPSGLPPTPFLRNPTSCSGPTVTRIDATSWEEPSSEVQASSTAPATTGCAEVPFAPTVAVAPDTKQAGAAGFGIDLNLPQNESLEGLATSDVKRVAVQLPAGVAINPSSANGLAGCADADFAISSSAEDHCPNGSKIGTVELKTPLLKDPLAGSIFLASPLEQGPAAAAAGQMYRLFLEVEGSGVRVKLAGSVVPDPVTGQLTATFDDSPQLPFETLHIELTGGARAPLTTPAACGTYTTHAELTPWARPTEPVSSDSSFTIDEGCGNAAAFSPSIEAGTTNPVAGSFSPFTLRVVGQEGQQNISRIQARLPGGVLAKLAGVAVCGGGEAAAGSCPAASQVGTTTVGVGVGSSPLYVPQSGEAATAVYLGGPYEGAPYSLVVKVPAQAGPFDLGTVTVQNALYIDPSTAQVTVKSDPLTQILDGVPVSYRDIRVEINRPGFTLNPTSCGPMQITGTLTSAQGSSAQVSSHFQAANCANLKFKPHLVVTTAGKTSRSAGAGLDVKLVVPAEGPQSSSQQSEANIAKVKVDLPKALPSRLSTLQKACTAAQFDANPAGCPAASLVGHAKAMTPILPAALEGPVYFVSHGGEAFPSLIMVLQGNGVTIDLVGTTFISKQGITSTTFKSVPDAPLSSFELKLPQGKYSALAANLPAKAKGSFCGQTLAMPTAFVAQNGAEVHASTKVTPTGCPKAKKKHKATKKSKAKKT
jgi:hypothetical protein